MPHASELSYLLIPPIGPDINAYVMDIVVRDAEGPHPTISTELVDGRFFQLDADLTPRSCYVAIDTPARLALAGAAASRFFSSARDESSASTCP